MVSPYLRLAAVVAVFCGAWRGLAMQPPDLGHARSFAVLGGSAVTNTGSTKIAGNVGVSPGKTVTGFSPGTPFPGDIYRDDALAREAQKDNAAAFRDLAALTCGVTLPSPLTGPLDPYRVYCSPGPLTGTLTLDAHGDADAYWIIQITGSLTTDPGSSVVLINGGKDANIFWQVDGSATLGAGSAFLGNLLARSSITLDAGASLSGRLLAQTGAVTLNNNKVTICCEPITLSPLSRPDGTAGTPYSATLTAAGGTAPYTFSIVNGTLPPGLTSIGGTISGTPTGCGGTFTFTVTATDANGCSVSQEYTIKIECTTTTGIVLSPPELELPFGRIGVPYSAAITASGEAPAYRFSVTCGELPPGLFLTEAGVIERTPSSAGTYSFAITATDALGHFGTRCYRITISDCPPITISPAVLPAGTVDVSYTLTLIPDGGSGFYAFTARREALPPGVELLSSGKFDGVPTKFGCYTFTVIVRDTVTGCSTTETRTICISCGPGPVITVLPPVLPDGIVGVKYKETITATGGSGSYTFTARPAALPPALVLLPDGKLSGKLSGLPTKEGRYTFTVTVLDTVTGCFVTKTYRVCFTCPEITINPPTLPTGLVNAPYPTTALTATPADRTYTFAIVPGSGFLPPDMDPLPPGGTVSGTPTSSGVFKFTVIATDPYGCFGTRDYTIVINPVHVPTGIGDAPALSGWGMVLLCAVLAGLGLIVSREGRL